MEQLPEEERQVLLFEVHQGEMVVVVDQWFCKHQKMKIPYRHIDTDLPLKLRQENEENPRINIDRMLKIFCLPCLCER